MKKISALVLFALVAIVGALASCSSAASTDDAANQTAAAAQATAADASKPWPVESNNELFSAYKQQCAAEPLTQDCEILRSIVVAEVVVGLELIERSGDQRGVDEGLKALDFPDEPAIFAAGCRVLGRFPATPGIVAKALPQLLQNKSIEVQRMAATLLAATTDPAAEVGRLWLATHASLENDTPYDEYPAFPEHYAAIGFPKYAGAEWFSPGDTDRSIGWSTKDDVATVVQWFGQTLKADAVDLVKWTELQSAELLALARPDPAATKRLQDVMAKAMKGDQAALAQYESMQKDIEKSTQAMDTAMKQRMDQIWPPDIVRGDARWIVAKRKDGRVSTVVLVYPMPALQRTVIQQVWHLGDYAPAWPQ